VYTTVAQARFAAMQCGFRPDKAPPKRRSSEKTSLRVGRGPNPNYFAFRSPINHLFLNSEAFSVAEKLAEIEREDFFTASELGRGTVQIHDEDRKGGARAASIETSPLAP
jgi:hypothetical protein